MTDRQSKRGTVLVIDDDSANAELLQLALQSEGYECQIANSAAAGLNILSQWPAQLVLLDYDMPVMNGLETLNQIKGMKIDSDVMFVSAHADARIIKTCLEKGADDFVRKPFLMMELLSRVAVRFRIRELRDHLAEANRRLQELNDRDDLTGLYNMRFMNRAMKLELDRARRTGMAVGCVMLDLDNFKSVNDSHDHLFGSQVIQAVGGILKKSVRSIDYPARYGGDEFMILLVDATDEGVKIACERIRQTVESAEFADAKGPHKQTMSIGFAVGSPEDVTTPTDLVRIADEALYEAKKLGRNRVVGRSQAETRVKIQALGSPNS